jgi:hypothetical protein
VEPVSGSFSFRLEGIGTNGVTTAALSSSPNLWADLHATNPSVNESTGQEPGDPARFNLIYKMLSAAGADEQFIVFPRSVAVPTDVSEAEDGDLVTVNFTCYGSKRPIVGRY